MAADGETDGGGPADSDGALDRGSDAAGDEDLGPGGTVTGGDATASDPADPDLTDSDLTDPDLADGDAEGGDTSLTTVAQDRTLPDVSDYDTLVSALESMLLVVDAPVTEETLAGALEQPVDRVTETLRTMAEDYTDRGSGFDLRRSAEGWRFYTRDTYAPFVEKLLLDGQRSKLTRAALETLAVIAYRQPVTRSRVAAVRGVNVDGVIRTLVQRGLIEESGADGESGGTLYVTTELFLERLGLESLNDLPPIAPLLPEVDSIDDI
ncbi:SMC-Scp complex subunit ScpB [Prauserella alba]|uniref:SMC-Scp complex subunit ScpB n=1 Tax=Prauserella alba TaxID=176898 RepID=UPI0020A60AE5|nr:SMC-Scp complex subunit ScpB [Prauserella alba]